MNNIFLKMLGWFSERKKEPEANELFHGLLKKFGAPADKDRLYPEGRRITRQLDFDRFVTNYLDTQFDSMKKEAGLMFDSRKLYWAAEKEKADKALGYADWMLNEQDETSPMAKLNKDIIKAKEEEAAGKIDHIGFPEKKMNEMVREAFDETKADKQEMLDSLAAGDDELTSLLEKSTRVNTARMTFRAFKVLLDDFAAIRPSRHYPPRRSRILLRYFICLLISFGEVGIIAPALSAVLHRKFLNNDLLSVLYGAVISICMSIALKCLGDALLYKGPRKALYFWLICVLEFFAMSLLLSHVNDGTYFSANGLTLAFFSVTIALANAFLYKKAAYLDDIYFEQNGGVAGKLEKKKTRHMRRWQDKKESAALAGKFAEDNVVRQSKVFEEVAAMLENQKKSSVERLYAGYRDAIRETAEKNETLILNITNNLLENL